LGCLCPIYKIGDEMLLEGFYLVSNNSANIYIHTLMSVLPAFSHGTSASGLGMGSRNDERYVQCPVPEPPYTKGGTVVFRLKRLGAVV